MTDKVQKILNEIQTRKLCTMDEHMAFYSKEAEADYRLLCEIEEYIKSMQEESVSEDLEIEIKHCIYEPFFDLDGVAVKGATKYLTVEDIADIARHFAIWQKQKDQETIELAEDHAMLAGMEKMKEQMMAKAVETTFDVSLPCGVYDKLKEKGCEEGDKLLIIKKEK